MTTQDYTDSAAAGSADINDTFARILAELDWLRAQSGHLASIGLRELRRTVRTYTLESGDFRIEASATASAGGVTVVLEDSGPAFGSIVRRVGAGTDNNGDHRLRITDRDFDQISYSRTLGRSRWVLHRLAASAASSALPPVVAA